jgi:proteasome lid subunit RPN8/RPN11
MRSILFVAAAVLSFAACKSPEKKVETVAEVKPVDTAVKAPAEAPPTPPLVRELKTKTGKTIVVTESHPTGASLSTVDVRFAGDTSAAALFADIDPVSSILVGDLDGNGFDELYVLTQAAGSGSYGNIHGVASNKDKSLSQIYVPAVEEADMKAGGKFEGYEGHDSFSISGKQMIREFPVKTAGKTKRTVTYVLKQGEASWKLDPVSSKAN